MKKKEKKETDSFEFSFTLEYYVPVDEVTGIDSRQILNEHHVTELKLPSDVSIPSGKILTLCDRDRVNIPNVNYYSADRLTIP